MTERSRLSVESCSRKVPHNAFADSLMEVFFSFMTVAPGSTTSQIGFLIYAIFSPECYSLSVSNNYLPSLQATSPSSLQSTISPLPQSFPQDDLRQIPWVIVATALIALLIFKEAISPRLWLGILFVTASCVLLSLEDISILQFNSGSLFVLLACLCWGIENNCTRKLSAKDPLQIVMIKGIFSGAGSIIIGLICGERILHLWTIPVVLLLGFVAYGLSIFFYVYAQRILGAARTSTYYAIAPFIGVILSLLIFREIPGILFIATLILMIIGAWLSSQDKPLKETFRKNQNRSISSCSR